MISKQEFEQFVPVATTPANQTGIYDMIKTRFDQEYKTVIDLYLGEDLADWEDMSEVLVTPVKKYVAISAFLVMFRELDLVLTPTGFGVVNNQNVAPASKERVDALFTSLSKQLVSAREELLMLLIKQSGWGTTIQAERSINTLCWTKSRIAQVKGIVDPDMTEYTKVIHSVRMCESVLADRISYEMREELLIAIRTDAVSQKQKELLDRIYIFMHHYIDDDINTAKLKLNQVVNYLNSNIDDFGAYKNSKAYILNNSRGYQNAKQDSTYFFKG